MMPSTFEQQNHIIKGGEYFMDVPVYKDRELKLSCWKLNKEEIEEILKTGTLWIHIYGNTFPHMRPSVFYPFKNLEPLRVSEKIVDRVMMMYVEGEELILLRVEEEENSFEVMEDDGWHHVLFKVGNDDFVYKNNYAFRDRIEIIGIARDCPEYWWAFKNHGTLDSVLILKRIGNGR